VRPEVQELEQLFLHGRNRTDEGKKVIEDLGFHGFVYNTKKGPTRLRFHCGAYSPWGGPNSCLLEPPREGPVLERMVSPPALAEVITSMAKAWDPDFAVATSLAMGRLVEKRKWEVRVGWLTYLSRRLGQVPPLPAPVRIEPVGALGWLLTLSPELMTASNPEHVAFTARVRELLDRAGLVEIPEPPAADA
jgi:hypothetical protein